MGIDQGWRKKAINSLKEVNPKQVLDVATGTADLAIAALKLNPDHITGIDISNQMLNVGRDKLKAKNISDKITLTQADSANLPFEDNKFDAITVAFGVRNFEFLQQGINQMYRVTRKGGKLAVLEFSNPKSFPFKQIYNFYFKY
jgi:demethylmenaquinone methyltransferase/2-methoxy-6-polyprenyl-1,4-benzoquinol methylase